MRGELFIVSAPSGAGKTTILKRVLQDLDNLMFSVSHTTRPPRPGEVDGVDYHFVDYEVFHSLVRENAFLEWTTVHNHYYGTSRKVVEDALAQGIDVILDIDVQGARALRKNYEKGVYVFIVPPGLDELERRLMRRGTETGEAIEIRLRNAREEIRALDEYDYIIVNDILDQATRSLEAVILSQRARRDRVLPEISRKLGSWN